MNTSPHHFADTSDQAVIHAAADLCPLPKIKIDPEQMRAEIPGAMQRARRWLLWQYLPSERPGAKPRKVPFYCDGSPRQGRLDTEKDWSRLVTMDEALSALARFTGYGLGFALGPDGAGHHWQGIDLDQIDQRPEIAPLVER